MPEELQEQEESTRKNSFHTLLVASFHAALEQWPVLKPIWDWIKQEGSGLKRGWVLFAVLTLFVSSIVGLLVHRFDVLLISKGGNSASLPVILPHNAISDSTNQVGAQPSQPLDLTVGTALDNVNWEKAIALWKNSRTVGKDSDESIKNLELAYVISLPLALKPPERMNHLLQVAHYAECLRDAYSNQKRVNDAKAASAADVALLDAGAKMSTNDTLALSSAIIRPAVELYNKLSK
jgi:hypothetical protein